MTFDRTLQLMTKYEKCMECGSEKIGNGQGKLIIEDNTFMRECKCGCSIKIDDSKKMR